MEGDRGAEGEHRGVSVASLRRTSPLHSPTRTLRLTEAELLLSQENTPRPISVESLLSRPRSNPRSRTPRRHESPLNPGEFRRESLEADIVDDVPPTEARRITIRPLAGSAVGATVVTRIHEERPSAPRSRKQGPSHRKVRRWNNEHFVHLAAELASSNRVAADVLVKAQSEAHLYRAVYNPADSKSYALSRFNTEEKLRVIRNRFFEGELPGPESTCVPNRPTKQGELSLGTMLNRIDVRLRRVVIKACVNSFPASKVVERFEEFVVEAFSGTHPKEWDWNDLLLEAPTISERKDRSRVTAKFYFDPESSTAGFHRLLLNAVCQFHSLHTVPKVADIVIDGRTCARELTVHGRITEKYSFRLLDTAVRVQETTPDFNASLGE